MRTCGAVLALMVIPALAAADDKKPLTPEAAAKKVNEECTVEMVVKSAGKGNGVFFLNSKEDFKDADNFTVFINDGASLSDHNFAEAGAPSTLGTSFPNCAGLFTWLSRSNVVIRSRFPTGRSKTVCSLPCRTT